MLFEDIARLWAHFDNFDASQVVAARDTRPYARRGLHRADTAAPQYAAFALEPPSSRWYHRLADRSHPNGDKNGNWEGVYPHGPGVHPDHLHRGALFSASRPWSGGPS